MSEAAFRCRSCGSERVEPVLSMGQMPLANALLRTEQLEAEEPRYPLELVFCPSCSLVQITETVPPEQLFREYVYFSSYSESLLSHAQALADRLVSARGLHEGSLVMEVASNDGYLLQYYRQRGVPVLGIEPAVNIAQVAERERGVTTLCEFFGEELAQELRHQGTQADVVHAHNVLAHVPDLNGFIRGLRLVVKEGGLAVIEVPYVKDLIDCCEFDTIYHEHLCYFSLTALAHLFRRHGLAIQDVERLPIHGGSLRLFVTHAPSPGLGEAVETLLREEHSWGVDRSEFYQGFAKNVEAAKASLCKLLDGYKQQGKRLAAYGAAAKGSVLLNYFKIGRELLDFVADRSTYKQGRFLPGVRLPICAPEKLLELMPDYVLLLAWNLADEILAQQAAYRQRGGRFIIPVPEVAIV
jgi:hypothetical protein